MRALSVFLDRLYLVAGWLAGGLLVLMGAMVCFNILARLIGVYSGGNSAFAGYVMAASTFLALAYTFRSGGHIRVALLIEHSGLRSRRWLEIFCTFVMALVVCFFAYACIQLVIGSYTYGDVSDGADATPLWIVQIPVAVGATIFAISCVHSFVNALVGRDPLASDVISSTEVHEI